MTSLSNAVDGQNVNHMSIFVSVLRSFPNDIGNNIIIYQLHVWLKPLKLTVLIDKLSHKQQTGMPKLKTFKNWKPKKAKIWTCKILRENWWRRGGETLNGLDNSCEQRLKSHLLYTPLTKYLFSLALPLSRCLSHSFPFSLFLFLSHSFPHPPILLSSTLSLLITY